MTSPPPSPSSSPPSPSPSSPSPILPSFRTHFISHEEVNKPSPHQLQQITAFSSRKTTGAEFDITSLLCRKREPTDDDDEKYCSIHSLWERTFPTPSVLKYNQKWQKIISETTSSPSSSPLSLFGLCDVEVSLSPTEHFLAAVSPYNCQFIKIDDFDTNGPKKQPCCYHFPPSTGPVAVKGSIGVSWSGDGCLFSVFFRVSGLVFIFYFPPKKQSRKNNNLNDRPYKKINKGGLIGVVSLPESNVFASNIIDAKLGNEIEEVGSEKRVNLFVLGENKALYCVSVCLSSGNRISWTPFNVNEDITQIKGEITHREDLSLSLSFATSLSLHFFPSSSPSPFPPPSSSFLFGEKEIKKKKEKTTFLSICGTGVKAEGAVLLYTYISSFFLVGSGGVELVGEGEKGKGGGGGGVEFLKALIGGKKELGKRMCKTSFSPDFQTICGLTSDASLVFFKKTNDLKVTKNISPKELQRKYSEYFPTEKGDNSSDESVFIWSMRWVSSSLLLLVWTSGNVNVITAETMTDASDSFDVFGYKHEPFPSLDSHLSLFREKTSVVISETVLDFLPVGNKKKIPMKEEHTTLFRYLPPSLLYENHIQNKNFEAAIAIAQEHGLDTDEATQKKWLASDLTRKSVKFYFKNMKNSVRAVAGCLTFSPKMAKEQLLLFVSGMQQCRPSYIKKQKQKGKEKEIEGENDLTESPNMDKLYGYLYLIFLDSYNRLLTYIHLCGGKGEEDVSVIPYSSEQFVKFRRKNLRQYLVDSISSKKYDQVSPVLYYHFDQVEDLYFPLLSSICETTPPKSYSFLLPGPDGRISSPVPSRYQLDGQEIKQTLNLPKKTTIEDLIEKLNEIQDPSLSWLHSFYSSFSPSISPTSLPFRREEMGEGVGDWYLKRASEIEEMSGLVNYAVDILEIGVKKGIPSLSPSLSVYRVLSSLVYSSSLSDISLSDVEKLDPFQILKLLGSSVTCFDGADDEEDTACLLVKRLYTRFLPLMKAWSSAKTTETTEELIVKYIETKLSHQSLLACRAIIIQSIQQIDAGTPEKALLSSISSIMRVTVKCVFSTTSPESWSQMLTFCKETEEWRRKHLKTDDPHLLDLADVMEVGSRLSLFSHQLCSPQQICEAKNDPVATEEFILRLCREALKSSSLVVWDEILKDILLIRNKLCPSLSVDFCFELLCECCLRSGCFTLPPVLDTKQVANVIFQVAQDLFRSGNTPNDDSVFAALSCIRTGPKCEIFSSEEAFYEAYISLHSEFAPEGKTLLNPTQFRTLDTKEIFQIFLTSPKMEFNNKDRLIDYGKIIFENRAVHDALDRQGEEGKNFLTTATKQSFLPPNFEDRTQELLLEVGFEALRRKIYTKAAAICDSLAQKQYQPCYRISEQLMTQESLPTAVRQKMSTYSLAFCPSKDLRDVSFKQTVFAQQQLHKQQHQYQQQYQPQRPKQLQQQHLGVHPFYLNLLGEVSSLHSGTDLPNKKILVATNDQDENAKFVSIPPLEELSRGLFEFSDNFSYWRSVQDGGLEASFYGMSDGRQWIHQEGKGEEVEREEERGGEKEKEGEEEGKDHPFVLAAQQSLPTDTPLSLSFLLSTLLTSPPPNTPLPTSHPPSLPSFPSPSLPLPPLDYEKGSEEMERAIEGGVEGGRDSEIYFVLTSYVYSLAILMLSQGKNANISLFSKTFSEIIDQGEQFLAENEISSLAPQSRFYCEKLKQLSKTTQTMSKEKEIRSFLPNVDVVKFMEDDEYKKEYIENIAKKEEIEIMIPIAEHFGVSIKKLMKIRIQELFREGLSFESEGDINDAKYNSQAIKDIFRFHKDHLAENKIIDWLKNTIFPLIDGCCHVTLTCYYECILEMSDPKEEQEIHSSQQYLLALEIVKKFPQDLKKKTNIFSLFADGITEEFCVIFQEEDVLPSLRSLSSSLPPISFLPPLWRALQIGIKGEEGEKERCQKEEMTGLFALCHFKRKEGEGKKEREKGKVERLVEEWVEGINESSKKEMVMERVKEVIKWEKKEGREEEEKAILRTKLFILFLLWEKITSSPLPLSPSLFPPPPSSPPSWDIQQMFQHLLITSSISIHVVLLTGIITIWERMKKDVLENRCPGDVLEEMGGEGMMGEVMRGKKREGEIEEEGEEPCSLWEGMWLFLYEKLLILEDFSTLSRVLTDQTFCPLESEGHWVSESYQKRLISTLLKKNGKGKEFLFCVLFGLLSHSSIVQSLSFSLLSDSKREIINKKEEEEKEEEEKEKKEKSLAHNSLFLTKMCENSPCFESISFESDLGQGVLLFEDWLLVLDAFFITGLFTTLTPKKYPFLTKEIDHHLWRCSVVASPLVSSSSPSPSLNSFFIDYRGQMERSLCSVVAVLCMCGRLKEALSLVIKAYKKISLHPALLRASYSGALLKKFLKTHLKMDTTVVSPQSSISFYKVKKQISSALQILS